MPRRRIQANCNKLTKVHNSIKDEQIETQTEQPQVPNNSSYAPCLSVFLSKCAFVPGQPFSTFACPSPVLALGYNASVAANLRRENFSGVVESWEFLLKILSTQHRRTNYGGTPTTLLTAEAAGRQRLRDADYELRPRQRLSRLWMGCTKFS